jgi:hypothetical protein
MLQIVPSPLLNFYSRWLTWYANFLKRFPGPLFSYFSEMAMLFSDWLKSRRPLYGLSIGAVGTIMRDLRFDGSKAERELGLAYTPIQQALHEEVASYLDRDDLAQADGAEEGQASLGLLTRPIRG